MRAPAWAKAPGNSYPLRLPPRQSSTLSPSRKRPEDSVLRVEWTETAVPDGAADLVADLYRRMPEARITDILLKVDDATRFTEVDEAPLAGLAPVAQKAPPTFATAPNKLEKMFGSRFTPRKDPPR